MNELDGGQKGVKIAFDDLDQLLEKASLPSENPWFATQVLHRLRDGNIGQRKIWPHWLTWGQFSPWRSLSKFPILLRTALAIFVIAAAGWGIFAIPVSSDSRFHSAASKETFAPAISAPEEEIPDEVVVGELEVLMADLNFQLWQQEEKAL